MKKKLLTFSILSLLALGLAACKGTAGPVGPKGDPGTPGEKGDKGDKGDPGEDAISIEEKTIDNLNLKLANVAGDTLYDRFDAANIGNLNLLALARYDNRYLYSYNANQFIVLDSAGYVAYSHVQDYPVGMTIEEDDVYVDLWRFSDASDLVDYASNYLVCNFAGTSLTEVNPTTGLDVGELVGLDVNYERLVGESQTVLIRTNGGALTINDTNAGSKQIHYGTLANADITTGSDCFYTHGQIAYMDLKQGKAVADNGGIVALMKAASGTEAEKINGGIIYIPDGTSNSDIELTSENLTTLGYVVEDEKINATAETKAANVYEIGSKAELTAFRDAWNKGEMMAIVPFILTTNIDISGENWTPIGNWGHPFNGTFDGNGKTISGLTAVGTLGSDGVYNIGGTIGFGECYGFIGIVGEGNTEIKDLTFTGVNINLVNGTNVGAVVGYAPKATGSYDGNVINTVGTLTLSGVTASGEINAKKHVGGLVGDSRTTGDVTFTNCVNNINITSTLAGQTGGIIGYANNCDTLTLTNSKNNGNITVTGTGAQGVAGLVGRVAGASVDVEISNCESNGNILSTGNISGVIDVEGQGLSSLSISNTKVTGLVVSTGAYDAYVLHGLPNGSPTITHSGNTFTGIVEANKGADTTAKNAKLNDVVAPDGYAMAGIYKVQAWGDPTIYHDANGDWYYYNSPTGIHQVGYVVYDTSGEWTQIEGKSIEYMAVGEGYYVFRVNGSDIYARYTENPETDYRTLSQHPNHGQFVPN